MMDAEEHPYNPPAWERKLKRACDSLNALLKEARQTHPNAILYLDGTQNLHLMWGASHGEPDGSGSSGNPEQHQERTLCSAKLRSSGGDW